MWRQERRKEVGGRRRGEGGGEGLGGGGGQGQEGEDRERFEALTIVYRAACLQRVAWLWKNVASLAQELGYC